MLNILKLPLIVLAALLLAAALPAQQQTTTCADGRVVLITPFNKSNPCGLKVVIDPAKDIPDDFLYVFGLPPTPTQNSLRDRIARIEYEQSLRVFRGLIDPPGGYFAPPQGVAGAPTVAEQFADFFMGEPRFFRNIYGEYVRFPDAPYGPTTAPLEPALLAPHLVIARYQVGAIFQGQCVGRLLGVVPKYAQTRNDINCAPKAEQEE